MTEKNWDQAIEVAKSLGLLLGVRPTNYVWVNGKDNSVYSGPFPTIDAAVESLLPKVKQVAGSRRPALKSKPKAKKKTVRAKRKRG